MRILPEICPRMRCPFSSFTRKVALGRVSMISPCIWITSSLAMFAAVALPSEDQQGCVPPCSPDLPPLMQAESRLSHEMVWMKKRGVRVDNVSAAPHTPIFTLHITIKYE